MVSTAPRRALVLAPTAVAAVLAAVYLIWEPPSADLAAQTFRADLFADHGFAIWTNAWYGGITLPSYSVLFPPLAAALGPRLVGALAAVAAAALFGALVRGRGGSGKAEMLGALWFGAATAVSLFTGRLTFALGVALGLGALLALQRRRPLLAGGLSVLTVLASPVAGLFLAIAGAAVAISPQRTLERGHRSSRRAAVVVTASSLATIAALALAFPVGGAEPFVASAFWNVAVFAALALILVPGDEHVLRRGIAIYAALAVAVFLFDNAVGGNAARLGSLFAGPVLAVALATRRPIALALVALPLLAWQVGPAIRDVSDASDDPSVERSFHQPLIEQLDSLTGGTPTRIEALPTRDRWEAVYVARAYPLARGWLRQQESDDFELFQHGNLTADSYLEWLRDHGVSFVAVPLGVDLDYLADDEAALIDAGLPYLSRVWESPDWRLYRVVDPPALVSTPEAPFEPAAGARLAALGPDSFQVTADEAGSYLIRVHYTRYWEVTSGEACVEPEGEWTRVEAQAPSLIRVEASFGIDALFGARDPCPG